MSTRSLLAGGYIGGPLFVAVFLLEGITRYDYDPLRHPISSLSIGPYGWMQITNFVITGILFTCFGIGLRQQLKSSPRGFWGPLLIGLAGLGLIGAGIFSSDPLYGYPSDLPFRTKQFTVHGHLHNIVSMFVFIGIPAACFVFRKRFASIGEHGWARYSTLSAIGMFLMFGLAGFGFEQYPFFKDYSGVFQRLSVMTGWGWITLLSWHFSFQTNHEPVKMKDSEYHMEMQETTFK